jgi:hypothetical protein
MAFLKTLLIILLIFFGLRIVFRLAKPYLMRYIAKKAGQRFEEMFRDVNTPPQQREGDISIDKQPSHRKSSKTKVGEYIEYEEVE